MSDNNQTINYCRVGPHYQNGIAKSDIKQIIEKTRTMLIHAKYIWPEVIQPCLWPFLLKQAEFNLNNLRLGKSGNCAPIILLLSTTKSTSGIIIHLVDWCTHSIQDYKVPVLFQNGTIE